MAGRLTYGTLLFGLMQKDDYEIRSYCASALKEEFGDLAVQALKKALYENTGDGILKALEGVAFNNGMYDALEKLCREPANNEETNKNNDMVYIMEMYHAGDPFLEKKAKDLAVCKLRNYINRIVFRKYPSYVVKYREDLCQQGAIGVITAMQHYEPSKGAFTTYAKKYIIHEISAQIGYINGDNTVHFRKKQRDIAAACDALVKEGCEITDENIALRSGISLEEVKIERSVQEAQKFVYLDANADECDNLGGFSKSPDAIVEENDRIKKLWECISKLQPEQKHVMIAKFIDGKRNEQIAREMGCTSARVKTLFQKALFSLRWDPVLRATCTDYFVDAEREAANCTSLLLMPSEDELNMDLDDLMGIANELEASNDSSIF